ncbi:MAG: imelysin [Bacteroidales bacterium]|nr:imelysin [Bacteroidales bacterium]MBR4352920.1 imelysin [Bacteroidales bacterium]
MKKICNLLLAAAFILSAASCNSLDPSAETQQDKALKAAVEQYVPGVIYKIYGNLADASETLYNQLSAMKASGSFTQSQIDQVCATFLEARKWWEQSEAFLYGAATAYGIDPHIDSWPLDKDKLAKSLSNAETIADLDEEGAGAVDEVGAASLGFHGIEFIIFRDGKNRTAAALNGIEDDEAFAGRNVSGKSEIIFAAAVAEDLRNYCFELQAAWDPDCPAQRVALVEDELEMNTTMDSGLTYGENLLETGNAGSTYRNWPEAISSILVAGCSNICNEVANTKIGTAHYVSSSDYDPDYIESPYSKKSYQDFKDNILSIQYSLYGAQGAVSAGSASIAAFLKDNKWDKADELESALAAAVKSLDDAMAKGAFVDNPTSAEAETCIMRINELDALLNDAADWISKL